MAATPRTPLARLEGLLSCGAFDALALAIGSFCTVTTVDGPGGLDHCLRSIHFHAAGEHSKADKRPGAQRRAATLTHLEDTEEEHAKEEPRGPDILAVDCEARSLSRKGGPIATIQLKANHCPTTFVVCLQSVQSSLDATGAAEDVWGWTPDDLPSSCSLRGLLASTTTLKLFIDCRKDAESLFHNHHIRLANVYDAQVAHSLCTFLKTGRHPTAVCPAHRIVGGVLTKAEAEAYHRIQEAGKAFHASSPHATAHWDDTPLPDPLQLYAASDVAFLGRVYKHQQHVIYHHGASSTSQARANSAFVAKVTQARINLAHSGDSDLTRIQMWMHPDLIYLVNPCMATQAPDTTAVLQPSCASRKA